MLSLHAKLILYVLLTVFVISGAHAQIYLGQSTPVLGQIQNGPMPFCIERKDAEQQMSAVIGTQGSKSWDKKVSDGKCGTWHGEYIYAKILSEGWTGHQKLFLMELKLRMKEWVPVFAFTTFKPLGLQLVSDDPSVHGAAGHDWYGNAQVTEHSRARLATKDFRWTNCCNKAEVVRTQFRSSKVKDEAGWYHDEWWYLHPASNEWRKIEDDIIHDADDNAPDGKPTLFIYNGVEVCFFLPRGEGG